MRLNRPFIAISVVLVSTIAFAQRISDSDLEHMMKNLRDDAKAFRSPFQSALKRSTLRKTSAEKNANQTAETFEKQTAAAADEFQHNHQAGPQTSAMFDTARRLNPIVTGLQPPMGITGQWAKVTQELEQVSKALGQPPVFGTPAVSAAAPGVAQGGVSCRAAVGQERAARLVSECLKVSPATHPPCNDQNSCVMVIDEIKRGCAQLGLDAPQFCLEYKN